jgi:predicted short-subunit dehydrogenase-like oxidoreductase (DUF2520 family)
VIAKHAVSARRAADLIGHRTASLSQPQLDRLNPPAFDRLFGSDLILIATPDDVLAPVAQSLARVFRTLHAKQPQNRATKNRIALHTSGALSSDVIKPLQASGFAVGSLHPLISIADPKSTWKAFEGAYFCVEGERDAVRLARSIVSDLNGRSFTIDAKSKALYHAAAVMSSGHVTALFDMAIEMLAHCGLSSRRAQQILLPLLASAAANLAAKNPAQALTGTFARGDLSTARKHLAAMKSADLKEAAAAYVLLGQRSLRLAKTLKLKSKNLDELAGLLLRYTQV